MRRSFPILAWLLLLLLLDPTSARAQYLYLDADGDGRNGSGDLLDPSGETLVDVWLVTDRNRDGSESLQWLSYGEAPCLREYAFILHAEGGAVEYRGYQDLLGFSPRQGTIWSATDFTTRWVGDQARPPGRYRLGSVAIAVLSGAPSIRVAATTAMDVGAQTLFASSCGEFSLNSVYGNLFWLDADGLSGTRGGPRAPRLEPLHDMTVLQGDVAVQTIRAADADGDTPRLVMTGGPAFATLASGASGAGFAEADLRVEPGAAPPDWPSVVTIRAEDAGFYDEARLRVVAGDPNFTLTSVLDQIVTQHVERFVPLVSTQSVAVVFALLRGPSYASLDPSDRPRNILLAPHARADVGTDTLIFAATTSLTLQSLRDTIVVTVLPNPLPPTIVANADPMVTALEGRVILQVYDPEDDPIVSLTFDRSGLPEEDAALFDVGPERKSATLHWTPTLPGAYTLSFTAADSSGATARRELEIVVGGAAPSGVPPDVRTGGPYEGTFGIPLAFDGSSSSALDKAPLAFSWDFGDGGVGFGAKPSHVYSDVGTYVVTLFVSDGVSLAHASTTATIGATAVARAAPLWGSDTIRWSATRERYCFAVESRSGSFDLAAIVPGSARLSVPGRAGLIAEVGDGAVPPSGDADGNGVPDRVVCFRREDVRALRQGAPPGRSRDGARLEVGLANGAQAAALVPLDWESPAAVDASIAPNPLRAPGVASLYVERTGYARVALHDVRGRRIRLLYEGYLAAGTHALSFDGRDAAGRRLPSGVYFLRLETHQGASARRLTILN